MMEAAMPTVDANSLPSANDFLKLSRKHTLVPVYRTVTADLEKPVSAFLRIAAGEPGARLRESAGGGRQITVQEGRRQRTFTGDVFDELKNALTGHTPAKLPGLPPFTAGAVG